jgi:hypothetical protein
MKKILFILCLGLCSIQFAIAQNNTQAKEEYCMVSLSSRVGAGGMKQIRELIHIKANGTIETTLVESAEDGNTQWIVLINKLALEAWIVVNVTSSTSQYTLSSSASSVLMKRTLR